MRVNWKKLFRIYRISNKSLQLALAIAFIGVVFLISTLSNVYTETYEIERFSNAKKTIRSPITIEDTQETERRRRQAVQSVEDRYSISNEITKERINYIHELFDGISTVQESPIELDDEGEEIKKTTAEKLQDLEQILSPVLIESIERQTLLKLMEASENERSIARELLTTTLYNIFNDGVRTEEVSEAVDSMNHRLRYSSLTPELRESLIIIGQFAVVENAFFSVEQTMEAEKQAINNVDPVMIQAGEVIVREGQTITNEIYEKLTLVGLLDSDRNVFPVIGLVLLISLLLSLITYEIIDLSRYTQLDHKKLTAITLISLGTVGLMKFVSYYATTANHLYILVPIATGTMLLKLLFSERIAITFAICLSIIGTVIFNGHIPGSLNIEAGIYFLFSQLAGILFLFNVKDRTTILKASVGSAIVNLLTVLLFLFLSYEKYELFDSLLFSGYALTAAFISCVLTIGILPFFESGLGILSDTKLLTLASPNHPLLRKILTEAPGTYHHSVMVANLSEAACEKIGANGLLARVASYYHDLGKTKHPHYFIENQMGMQNPHEYLEPMQSAAIIISHPYDGAAILREHKIPKEIIDISEQHHGTTLLKYFYYKAKNSYKKIEEEDFRYPGPRPRTKEAAVISICDSIEAAVRSLDEPTKEKIDEMITSIMHDRLTDGQLNESSLTFSELEVIKTTISETLNGIYHSRIQYPTDDKTKEAL
ncbi:cyclic-di-AMP phosphodiesterase PgpH [Paraliobacillus quinghaiensis]|uniref:Cyclic-di-AMP phosphodiesterase PgpH n=1 Tax=Paraliobacillus quinghaiensis TaxID=470815 RepID=A0A917WTP0_9BACI|nr:HDIG domain-containing metalloprotein [Paraliobacillus quinghaiensis]GGM31267.1 cyclic-di-AMP phosphodiesterase PgpH [Paraliobacillus quinghaiensis]